MKRSALFSLVALAALTAPAYAQERFALLGAPALQNNKLEVRLLWTPQQGWLPAGGFALYRSKGSGQRIKLATLKPDSMLLPDALKAQAALGAATAKLREQAARPASSFSAFQTLKREGEQLKSNGLPPVQIAQRTANIPEIKILEPKRQPRTIKVAPTPEENAAALRDQVVLSALLSREKAKGLALGYDDTEVVEGDTLHYELVGIGTNGAEEPGILGSLTLTVRTTDTRPPAPDPQGFTAAQLDQDSVLLHWEHPGDAEFTRLVLPHYDVIRAQGEATVRKEQRINEVPILLTSYESQGSGKTAPLVSFQDDRAPLGLTTWSLTVTDAFGRTSTPVTTQLTVADLRVPAPVAGLLGRWELDRASLGRQGMRTGKVTLYWAAPADKRNIAFDLWRTDTDNPTTRVLLNGSTPITGNVNGADILTMTDLAGLTGDTSLIGLAIDGNTLDLDTLKALTGLNSPSDTPRAIVQQKLRAALQGMTVGMFRQTFPALANNLNALTSRVRWQEDASGTPDRYYRYEVSACYPENHRDSVPAASKPVGIPLLIAPAAPGAPAGQWTRNPDWDAGTVTLSGQLRDAPAPGSGAFVKPKASTKPIVKPGIAPLKPIAAKLGGTVNVSWGAVPQTPGMKYRVYRACATGFFPGITVTQTGTGIGKHISVAGGILKKSYFAQYTALKDTDFMLLGSTDKTTWADPLPPSQRCVWVYKVEAVNRWGISSPKSAEVTVNVAATLPPSAPNLTLAAPKDIVNIDGAVELTFTPNPAEERAVEYRVLRADAALQNVVTMAPATVRVASARQPQLPSIQKPRLSQTVGGAQLAPQGPEAQRVGFPSTRFGVMPQGGAFRAIEKQKLPIGSLLKQMASYKEVGKVNVPVGSSPPKLTFTDTTAKPGTEYVYKLVAINDDGIGSLSSNLMDARPFTKTPKPTGMGHYDDPTRTVNLTWNSVSGAGGYFIRRKLGSGPSLQLAALVAPTTAFSDKDVRMGRTYTYQIFASDKAGGISDPLEVTVSISADTEALPPGPTGPQGENNGTKPPPLANGEPTFGQPVLLANGMALTIHFMKYTIEPHPDYDGTLAEQGEKLLWITFGIQNRSKERHDWAGFDVTAYDSDGKPYTGGSTENSTSRSSKRDASFYQVLQPEQEVGMDPVREELSAAIRVPGTANITRLELNKSLNAVGDKKVVYTLTGKNAVTPLPEYAGFPIGAAKPGIYYPAGYFAIRFDNLFFTESAIYKDAPLKEGMRYAVATFTAKNIFQKTISTFELYAQQSDAIYVRDAEGNEYKTTGDANYAVRKPKSDEVLKSEQTAVGDEVTYRYIFQVPKNAKITDITFGQNRYGHLYRLSTSGN